MSGGPNLLLIDEDERFRNQALEALAERRFRVKGGRRLAEAASLLASSSAQVLVTDIDTNPTAGLLELTKLRKRHATLPVALLCDDDATYLKEASELGHIELFSKPADIDAFCVRLRAIISVGEAPSGRERSIAELMVPPSSYNRVFEDQPLSHVIRVLAAALGQSTPSKITEQGHRSVLVYSREDSFLGCIRLNDVLEIFRATSRQDSSLPLEPGMFASRCKLLAGVTAGELLGEQTFVDIDAPLMEAAQLMLNDGLINIPVLQEGKLVGVLTDKSLILSMCDIAGGC